MVKRISSVEEKILAVLWTGPTSKTELEISLGEIESAINHLMALRMILVDKVCTISCATGRGKNKKSDGPDGIGTLESLITIFRKRKKVAKTLAGYKTYDNNTEKCGSPDSWKKASQLILGSAVKASVYFKILGFSKKPETLVELKKQYLNLLKKEHPDMGGDPKKAETIISAYQVVKKLYID